jgi:hypothetical protein
VDKRQQRRRGAGLVKKKHRLKIPNEIKVLAWLR